MKAKHCCRGHTGSVETVSADPTGSKVRKLFTFVQDCQLTSWKRSRLNFFLLSLHSSAVGHGTKC